jgi:putative SOS response-associated peptidase YedK
LCTTTLSEVCAPIHECMPVIVAPEDYRKWLGEDAVEPVRLLGMLKPYPADRMMSFPVEQRVGNVKNDDVALIEPLAVA